MIAIEIKEINRISAGYATVSGLISDNTAQIYWGLDNDPITNSDGFSTTTGQWALEVPIRSGAINISIRANLNGDETIKTKALPKTYATAITPTFMYNEIDELAYPLDVERIVGESNSDLIARSLDTLSNRGNSTLLGRVTSIDRGLGLPPMPDFFSIATRWNPSTGKGYHRAWVNFSTNSCYYQDSTMYITNFPVQVDPLNGEIVVDELIGYALESGQSIIVSDGGNSPIPPAFYKQTGAYTLRVDLAYMDFEASPIVYVTYPFMRRFIYNYMDTTTNTAVAKTVVDLKAWLTGHTTVTDENLTTKPLVRWSDGYMQEIDVSLLPVSPTFEDFPTVEQAFNKSNPTAYSRVETSIGNYIYFKFIPRFPVKSNFTTDHIIPTGWMEIGTAPLVISASWTKIYALSDPEFRETTMGKTSSTDKNLKYYAELAIEKAHMGVEKTVVDRDYWDSDSPKNIGDNFIPSEFDTITDQYDILSDSGDRVAISLHKRRYAAMKLASAKVY